METMGNELTLSLLIGVLVGTGIYSLLRRNLLRVVFGILLISNGVNLMIFTVGDPRNVAPPLIPDGADAPVQTVAQALPQALILTAIVISFGLVAFTLVLLLRGYGTIGTVRGDHLVDARIETERSAEEAEGSASTASAGELERTSNGDGDEPARGRDAS